MRGAAPLLILLIVGGSAQAQAAKPWKTDYARVGKVPISRADAKRGDKQGMPPAKALQRLVTPHATRQHRPREGAAPCGRTPAAFRSTFARVIANCSLASAVCVLCALAAVMKWSLRPTGGQAGFAWTPSRKNR